MASHDFDYLGFLIWEKNDEEAIENYSSHL